MGGKNAQKSYEKTIGHESDGDTNNNWWAHYSHLWFGMVTEGLGNKRMSGDNSNYSIVEIGQNAEKCLVDTRGLVTQLKNVS